MTDQLDNGAEARLTKEIIHSGSRAVVTPTNLLIMVVLALVGSLLYVGERTGQITQNEKDIRQETIDRKEGDREIRLEVIRAMDNMSSTVDTRVSELRRTVDSRISELIEVIKERQLRESR